MPPGTASRVARRRAAAIATATAVVVALVVGAAGLYGYLSEGSATEPAGEATAVMPSPTGPEVTTPTPFADLAPGEWPDVTNGGVRHAYVDRTTGDGLDKQVVASGTVEGAEWSQTAFAVDGWGACGELFLGETGEYGGVRFCSAVPTEPGQTDLRIAGTSFGLGPVTVYAGVASDAIDRVVFEFDDGSRRAADLADAPSGLDERSFVLFVPNDASGRVIGLGPDGARVAEEPLCVGTTAAPDQVAGCGNGLAMTFSAVSAGS